MHDEAIHGYEILNRPLGIPTELYYDQIVQCGCYLDVDLYLAKHSLKVAKTLPGATFINVFPTTLLTLQLNEQEKRSVVFELNERGTVNNLVAAVPTIHEQSLMVAIDDVCKGYAGLCSLVEINPTFIKLDKWLISGIEASTRKQDLVHALVGYAKDRSQVIAEGVENQRELDTITKLGVRYGQGYFLAKPRLYSYGSGCEHEF